MPVYCFTNARGETIDRFYELGACPEKVRIGKLIYRRDMVAEFGGRPKASCATWPMVSDAAGCSPEQVEESREEARRNGVPTEFTKAGQAIFTSARHRKAYCEMYGLYDRNGGYGDPQRK